MSALDRELIKWIQSMDLSHPLKNPRRDLGNGFLVAEILSRYDRTVEMHSFDTGSAMSRRLDNWQQIRKLLVNRGCVSVSEEMMDSAIQMRGEGATNILEALYEHLTKKRLQAGKVTAEKKEALAANQDLKAKAVLDTPAFMRPTAAALLRENNDETINRLQRLTGRTNENIINQKNEELLTRHGLIMQAAKEASPERYEPKKPTLRGMNHTTSPNGSSRRQTWGNSTPGGEGGGGSAPSSSRTRQKLVVAKHLDVRVVDESVLATFAAREQQAKEEALKNGFDTSESLPVALSRVVYRILKSYGIVEAVDEGYEELFGEGGGGYNISQFSEEDGLGLLIESTQKIGGAMGDSSNDSDEDYEDSNKVPTNSSSDNTTGGELDVAGTGDYFTKFLVLRERIPLEIKTYVWNSLVSATELATAPTTTSGSSEENGGGGGTHRERGSTSSPSSKSVGVVARNTARLIADRPSEFQHLAVLFSFALGRNASQVALASSLYNSKVHNCSKTNNNSSNTEEEDAAFALDCEFVYRFLESVGQSLGDRTSQEDGAVTNATTSSSSARANHHGLNTDSADFATKLLIPQILSAYLLPLGTSYILEWCARLILAYTPVRHASEIRSVMNSLQQALTSKPPSSSQSRGIVVISSGNSNNKKPSSSATAVGVLNDRYYVVAMNILSQVLFETITSSGSGGNAGLLYTSLCELNVSVAKEALLGNSQLPSSEDYKFSATATSKASGLHLLRRTMLPYDVLAYHQSYAPSLATTSSGKEGNNNSDTSALSITAVERFRNSNDTGNNSGGQNNSNGTSLEGVPALADKLLAVAASLALRGTASGIRGPTGLSPTILQEALSNDELYTPTSAASSALRTVTSMISRQLPRFLMLEAAFRAPRDLGVSGTHHILYTEVLEPYQQFMAAHTHQRAVSKNERRAQNILQLRDAIVAHRRARIEEESQGEATLEEADINEIYTILTEDDVIEIARLEIPDSEEIAALDNLIGSGDIFANAAGGDTSTEGGRDDGDSDENDDEDAVRMHRFFTGASATGDVAKDCWFGQALTSAAQNDSNWEVRLAALETAAVLKYTAEHFVVEGQLGPEVDTALAALASTEGASSLEMDLDEEPADVKEKRAILEKAQNALNAAVNFLETVVGRAQESAFIYFDTKTPALRRQSMVAIAPFLQQPPPPSTMVDEDGNILSTPLDNSSSIMASLFVQRIVEDLRATVSASAAIALAHDKDCRNKTKTESSANSVSELIQHLITKNKASDKLRLVSDTMASLASSSDTITFPLDLRDHPSYSRLDEERLQHSSPTPPPQSNNNSSSANSDSAVITVGGKVVSVGVCSSILQFVDPLVLAGCVVSHIHHGQTELQAVEELVREEQVYQQATLGSAEVRPGGGDVSADIHAFVSQRTSPVCSTFEIVWLLEAIFTRAVSLSGVTTQLNNLITAVAISASSPPGDENAEGDALDAKSVISTTSTSAVARMAQKQRNKAASPQAASITASINNNPTHQRYRTFLETIDSSSRQGWMRILAEVKSHLLDSVSDPENIQQLPINEPLMQTLDDIGAALQQQFQRDRVETQQRAKELGNGAISEGPSPPDATDLFAHEVQTRCYHVLTKVYRDLKNNNQQSGGGGGEAAYQPLTPRDEADANAEKEASVDWLVAML